jgi:hypothetical protein
MNDEPRFRRVEGKFEDTYPNYFGSGLVAFVLRLAENANNTRQESWLQKPAKHEKLGISQSPVT